MSHLRKYLELISDNIDLKKSIQLTSDEFAKGTLEHFTYQEHITGLLLGNVQSGKTGQMFGILASCADNGIEVFILLTSDNVYLQEQTFTRAISQLDSFNVCGESDEIRFVSGKLKRPTLIILKKNTNILSKWRNIIAGSQFCQGRAIVIMDDEADAASLNTKVNKKEVSQINKHILEIRNLGSSSIYLQVTATPQAILLQTKLSDFKPSFIYTFQPGKKYLGGEFFYSNPRSYTIKLTAENELDDLREPSEFISQGLHKSLMTFLVTAAHVMNKERGKVCNFLIHPSVRISDHEALATKIGEYLNSLISVLAQAKRQQLEEMLNDAWEDLQSSKPDLIPLHDAFSFVLYLLDKQEINIVVMNSVSPQDIDTSAGVNIIIGGNSLGRGVTFPGLQTVYYCRKSKTPQADTFWQHCRMFGYDRDPALMRVFIPPSLLKLFTELSVANTTLFNQIEQHGLDDIALMYPGKIRPTRKNVLDSGFLNLTVGGVNYFPKDPINKSLSSLDTLLKLFDEKERVHEVDYQFALELLSHLESKSELDWNKSAMVGCLKLLKAHKPLNKLYLIVRRNRDIGYNTGTLLSPDDRGLGAEYDNATVLTMYRILGSKEKGWAGKPIWIPNIKFPVGCCYYKTNN